VGEVVFPNTIPPFFPTLSFLDTDVENPEELRLRWAGLRAHNRWLADFCAELPGRRAGVGQILLHDIESALDEIRRIKQSGLFGGVLLPIPTPGSGVAPLHAACYEPVWALCEDLEVPIAAHGGGGVPNEGAHPASGAMIWVDSAWFSRRPLAHLIFGGVFERHPGLKFAITETANSWVPETLASYDWVWSRIRDVPQSIEARWGSQPVHEMSMKPSQYWARNCWQGNSFMGPVDCELRYDIGIDKMMWGSDYPHYEGTAPYTREAMRWTFQNVDPVEVQRIIGGNAADLYGFDMEALSSIAQKVGPSVGELAAPMDVSEIPADAKCEALAVVRRPVGR
jgi:predicted TIM-barrel fold metal-dependent hydrolase